MSPAAPASLDTAALARRLAQLTGEERAIQVEFLLHLDVFDRRRAWLEAGHPSLWDYCLRVLHLREGAAARRLRAMRILRRLPDLSAPLRDGRICLTTLGLLEPVLTAENAGELIARAAYRSKAEVEELVAALRPRAVPRDGVRRVVGRLGGVRAEAMEASGAESAPPTGTSTPNPTATPTLTTTPTGTATATATLAPTSPATTTTTAEPAAAAAPPPPPAHPARPTLRPVAADTWSLRVTVDAGLKQELDQLAALLSHKIPSSDLPAVLREAVHCALEKHGKRKGAVAPRRTRRKKAVVALPDVASTTRLLAEPGTAAGAELAARPSASPISASDSASRSRPRREPIPAEVRRQVWQRDGGRCAWTSPDGHRCGSRWKVEVDHLEAAALGGPSTLDNLRLTCAAHNRLHAERTFGRAFMDRFRSDTPRLSESTVASGSDFGACGPR